MKTIVITGASSGIGKATAKFFAKNGWQVAATMRHPEKETELTTIKNVKLFQLDVTNSSSIDTAFNQIKETYSTIDVLVNNAGYCLFGPLELSTEEQIRKTYDTLLVGLTLVTRKFIPLLRENKGGTIISISSVGGVMTLPLTPTYHAAKYAVEGLMEGLSYELAPFHIDCKIIEPGGIQTDFWSRSYVMTKGIKNSPYDPEAINYLNAMTAPQSDNRAQPEEVAKVIFEAATDKKHQWRYMVACEDFINWRRTMSDEQWYELTCKQYMGGNHE